MTEQDRSGSWLGFTYNGIHSSTLGIVRTISGRFNENLIPTMKDTTANIEGIDGMVYWGTKYTKRDIPVSFAFQGMSNAQLTTLSLFLEGKEIHDLIFDEAPYKIYSAKITGSATMKYIAFEDESGTYYNGEGNITFTCYFPYARGRYKWQHECIEDNKNEWLSASRIPIQGDYGTYDTDSQTLKLYNAGDIDMPLKLWFPIYWASVQNPFNVTIACGEQRCQVQNLARWQDPSPTGARADWYILVDLQNMRIEGYDDTWQPTGRFYDKYMSGTYFLIPPGEQTINITTTPEAIDFYYLYI